MNAVEVLRMCATHEREREALARLARLVEADYAVNQAKRRYHEATQTGPEELAKGCLMQIWVAESDATEALAAVLGEEG